MSSAVTGMVASDLPALYPDGRPRQPRPSRRSRGKIAAMSLLARRRYPEVAEAFDWASLWTLMDGDRSPSQHRPRVRRSLGRPRHRAAPAVRRRPARGVELRRPGRLVRPLRQLPRAPRCRRAAIASRCCSSPPCPSTARSSAFSSAARSPCRSSRSSAPMRSAPALAGLAARACSWPGPRPIRSSTPSPASRCCGVDDALAGAAGRESPRLPRRHGARRSGAAAVHVGNDARACPRASRTPIARSSRS